jgi:sugar phosphate permease
VKNPKLFYEACGLGALSSSWRSDEDHAHGGNPTMRAGEAQRTRVSLIVEVVMQAVPWWFQTLAHVLAVAFALWVGVHIYGPVTWIGIYAVAALMSALLPAHRLFGFVGLGVGIAIGACGIYLLRDVWRGLSFDALISPEGGPLGGGRDAIALAIAGTWLVLGSAFRTQRA